MLEMVKNKLSQSFVMNDSMRDIEFMLKREQFIIKQYQNLINQGLPGGIYLTQEQPELNEQIKIWNGVIFVRSGLYEGAAFKFNLIFPDRFPLRHPQIQFLNKIFHPLIDFDSGYLDYSIIIDQNKENSYYQPENNSSTYRTSLPIFQDGFFVDLMQFIWNVFYDTKYLKISTSFNKKAAELYKFNLLEFLQSARLSVEFSNKAIEVCQFNEEDLTMLNLKINYENQEEIANVQRFQLQIKQKIQDYEKQGLNKDQIIENITQDLLSEIQSNVSAQSAQ